MPLTHLEHFLIQTEDLDGTCNWYVDVLGMEEGPHPDFKMPVRWLYLGDEPVLHLTIGGENVSENRKKSIPYCKIQVKVELRAVSPAKAPREVDFVLIFAPKKKSCCCNIGITYALGSPTFSRGQMNENGKS